MSGTAAPTDDDLHISTDGLAFDDFASMVEGDDAEQTLQNIERDMKETGFGQVEVTDFADFNRSGRFAEEGSHSFTVEARYLLGAANIMNLVGKVGARSDNVVKIIVMKDRLKLSSYNKVAFAEYLIPTATPTTVIDDTGVAFVFDLKILGNLARNLASGGIIDFTFNAKRRELAVHEGSTNLILSTRMSVDFAEFHSQIAEPQHIGAFDPLVLRAALQYLNLFSQRDDTQKSMGIVNVDSGVPTPDKGRAYGGSHNGIAVYEAKGLANIKQLRIPNPAIDPIQKIIAKMHPEHSHMFKAGKFVIFRDQNLYLGFELTEYAFPDIARALEMPIVDKVSITRANILAALQKLSIVNSSLDATVRMTISGVGTAALLKLEVFDPSGKVSSDQVSITRDLQYEETDIFDLTISVFKRTLEHFKTENVVLEPTDKSIMVRDDSNEYSATTLLTKITPEVRQTIEANKAEARKAKIEADTGVTEKDLAEVADEAEDDLVSAVD